MSVLPYAPPAITRLSAFRCDADGNTDDNGDYTGISYAYSISSVNSKNTKSAVIQYKRSTGSSWTNLLTNSAYSANTTVYPTTELLSDYQWDIRLTVSDYFGSSEMTVTLPSAEVLMDLLASGDGMGIGKTAEQANMLDIEWPVRIGGKVVLRTDGEGGNLRLDAPDSYGRHWEMDAHNGSFRIYTQTNDYQDYQDFVIDPSGNVSVSGDLVVNGVRAFIHRGNFSGNMSDINIAAGTYWCNLSEISGGPGTSGWGWLLVYPGGNLQQFVSYNSHIVYSRGYTNGQWYPWHSAFPTSGGTVSGSVYATGDIGFGNNNLAQSDNVLVMKVPVRAQVDVYKRQLYTTADTIAGSVSQHLTIPSELAGVTNAALLRTADATLANIPSTYSSAVQTGASSGTGNSEELLRKAVALLDEYLPEVAGMQVVLDTGAAVGAMAPAMDQALGRRARMKARG